MRWQKFFNNSSFLPFFSKKKKNLLTSFLIFSASRWWIRHTTGSMKWSTFCFLNLLKRLSTSWLWFVISVKKVRAWRKNITLRETEEERSVSKKVIYRSGSASVRGSKGRKKLQRASLQTSDLWSQLQDIENQISYSRQLCFSKSKTFQDIEFSEAKCRLFDAFYSSCFILFFIQSEILNKSRGVRMKHSGVIGCWQLTRHNRQLCLSEQIWALFSDCFGLLVWKGNKIRHMPRGRRRKSFSFVLSCFFPAYISEAPRIMTLAGCSCV